MVWYDYCVIRLNTLFESLGAIGLTKRADLVLRLYVNTGTLNVAVSSPNTTTPGYSLTQTNNGFNGTCPFTIVRRRLGPVICGNTLWQGSI